MNARVLCVCRRIGLVVALGGGVLFQTGCTLDSTLSSLLATYGVSSILSLLTSSTTSG